MGAANQRIANGRAAINRNTPVARAGLILVNSFPAVGSGPQRRPCRYIAMARADKSSAKKHARARSISPPPPLEVAVAGVAVTVTDCEPVPPGPVQVNIYVVVAVTATDTLPDPIGSFPVNVPPLAVHINKREAA